MKNIVSKLLLASLLVSTIGISNVEARNYDTNTRTYYHNAKIKDFPLYMNGETKNTDYYKLVVDGRTYLSLRDIATVLGVEVRWDSNKRVVYIEGTPSQNSASNGGKKYLNKSTVKSTEVNVPIYINNVRKYPNNLELIAEGRIYLSIRDIADMIDIYIGWDDNTKSIYMSNNTDNSFGSEVNNNTPINNTPIYNAPVNNLPTENAPVNNTIVNVPINNTPVNNTPVKPQEDSKAKQQRELEQLRQENSAQEMLRLVNEFRAENGKKPLELIPERDIQNYTDLRARELSTLFSHTRPDGSSVGDYSGLNGLYLVGENNSAGRKTIYEAVESWKKSPGHRRNMLNDDYTHMYSGYDYNENSTYGHYHIQLFGISLKDRYKQPVYNTPTKQQEEQIVNNQQEIENQQQQNEAQENERIRRQEELENLRNQNTPEEMLRLVNEFREENGKKPLELIPGSDIQDYANLRAQEISRVFSHTRPDGSSGLSVIMSSGGVYAAGENITAGRTTLYDAVESWKDSSGHRDNMLNDRYTHMYSGYYYDGSSQYGHYHVQIFVGLY